MRGLKLALAMCLTHAALAWAGPAVAAPEALRPQRRVEYQRPPISEAEFRQWVETFLERVADEWVRSEDPAEQRWAKALRAIRQEVIFRSDIPAYLAVGPFVDAVTGNYPINEETGFPYFTLIFNPDFFREFLWLADHLEGDRRRELDRILVGFLVKEFGGLECIREHPYVGRSRQLTAVWLLTWGRGFQIDERSHELIRAFMSVVVRPELAGYIKMMGYYSRHEIEVEAFRRLEEISHAQGLSQAAEAFRSIGAQLERTSPDHPDLAWRLAMDHILAVLSHIDPAFQASLFALAQEIEIAEGHAIVTPENRVAPVRDQATGYPVEAYMGYLREPRYHAFKPEELERLMQELGKPIQEANLQALLVKQIGQFQAISQAL